MYVPIHTCIESSIIARILLLSSAKYFISLIAFTYLLIWFFCYKLMHFCRVLCTGYDLVSSLDRSFLHFRPLHKPSRSRYYCIVSNNSRVYTYTTCIESSIIARILLLSSTKYFISLIAFTYLLIWYFCDKLVHFCRVLCTGYDIVSSLDRSFFKPNNNSRSFCWKRSSSKLLLFFSNCRSWV